MSHLTDELCQDDDMAKLADMADVYFLQQLPRAFCASWLTEEILSKTKDY